ncbi:hypothetical protein JCM10449v2_001275 [Rhodotorula kratochvilovae]
MAPRLPLPTSPTLPVASLLPREHTPFTLIYASHARWPLPPGPPSTQDKPRRLRVCVLESSWNPPTLSHVSLAQHCADADAHLLALTIGNPDKGRIDERAATVRVEMMREIARDLERRAREEGGNSAWANVAVAVTEAPTFTEKSRILRGELDALVKAQSGEEDAEVRLTFPVGWDTVIRIFAPRYYQPPAPDLASSMASLLGTDDSSLVCARRGGVSPEEEVDFLASEEVKKWVELGKVEMFDLPEAARDVSSTRVRQAVKEGRWVDVERDVPFERVIEIVRREGLYRE